MLKRILTLLTTLALLLTLPAAAEELYDQIDAALYQIVLRTDEGDKPLGSGVLFADASVLLTAEGCWAEGSLYAIGTDGEHPVKEARILGSGAALLTLGDPSSAQPLTLAPADVQSLPYIFGANAGGERGTMPLYNARADMRDGTLALLLSSEEGLLPGAFLTDEQGRVTALITAQQMEGEGSYAALGVTALSKLLSAGEPADDGLLPCTFAWEDGQLTVSWEDAEHTEGVYVLTILSDQNLYYTSYEAEITERSMTLTPPPGHTYAIQVQRAASEAEALPPVWENMQDYTLPLLPYKPYGIQAECSLTCMLADDASGDEAPVTAFTSAMLTDPQREYYLSVDCSYDVPDVHAADISLELIAPDGQFFFDEQTIELDPADASADSFILPLDGLLASCAEFSGGELQEGLHTVRFFLDGLLAGEYAFTVTADGETPAASPAEPATEGYASSLTRTHENGLLTLTWDAASIPEGMQARAYCLYGGNTYYSYFDLEPGASTAEFLTVPGRQTAAWIAWSASGESVPSGQPAQDQVALVEAAEETLLTARSFRNVRIGLAASADPKAAASTDFLPQAPITREMLADRSTPIYFMTEDTYQVGATTENHPLVIALLTPDGMCFADLGYYIFDRSLQSSDLWLKDISILFASYESLSGNTSWPAGEYRLLYCIDGQVAGEIRFTLE